MKHLLLTLILFIWVLLIQAQSSDNYSLFVKPLELPPAVSGSFGELRTNHFHSGLDLTTNGKTGYEVHCSDKGYVSRIKVSPFGYGKAIYVNHPSGYTTVYGHLEDYSPRIDSMVQIQQYQQKSFAIDIYPEKHELPVERGEVIAYSGNSGGSGGPHIHYEVRNTETQIPMNPLFFRNDISDDVRPLIRKIKIYPLTPYSTIDGKNEAIIVSVVFYDGEFHLKGRSNINANGSIGIGVDVIDYFTDNWRKCGVYSVKLSVDSVPVFYSEIDKFSFAESRYINSHIDYAEKQESRTTFQKSFVDPNNELSIYKIKSFESFSINEGERKAIEYLINDLAGNTSILKFNAIGETKRSFETKTNLRLIKYHQAFRWDTLGFSFVMPSKAIYKHIPFLFEYFPASGDTIYPIYKLCDDKIPMHKFSSVSINCPDELKNICQKVFIGSYNKKGQLDYIGGKYKDGKVTARVRGFGSFSIGVDTIAPTIKELSPPVNKDYRSREGINVMIKDETSGIESYTCYIDDKWALFEYDAKNNLLNGDFKRIPFLKAGQHRLKVLAKDNLGNYSTYESTFTY